MGALLQIAGGILETIDRVRAGEPGFVLRSAVIGAGLIRWRPAVDGMAGHVSRWALGAAAGGWVLSAVAQFTLPAATDLAEQVLFPAATVLTGLGMAVAGVVALRVRGHRWPRFAVLACGLYPFLVIFPLFAATGGPQFLVLSGWGLCWLLLNAVAYRRTQT